MTQPQRQSRYLNIRPAEYSSDCSDSDSDADYGRRHRGGYATTTTMPSQPASPELQHQRAEAALRVQRENAIIEIIAGGSMAELAQIHSDPPGFEIDAILCNKWPPIMYAAEYLRIEALAYLCGHGCQLNMCVDGTTPLVAACSVPDREDAEVRSACNVMVMFGANPNFADSLGRTALMLAAKHGYRETVKALLERYASVEQQDNEGSCSLFYAVEQGRVEVVRELLANGCTVEGMRNGREETVREWARMCGWQESTMNAVFGLEEVEYVVPAGWLEENSLEALAPSVFGDGSRPDYFCNVRDLLRGMRSHHLMRQFAEAHIGLPELLVIDEARLKHIGVTFPFQRARIRYMVQLFHEHEFSPRSLASPQEEGNQTTVQLFSVIAAQLKHLIMVRASIEFTLRTMAKHSTRHPNLAKIVRELSEIGEKARRIRAIVAEIDAQKVPAIQYIGRDRVERMSAGTTKVYFSACQKVVAGIGGGLVVGVILARHFWR